MRAISRCAPAALLLLILSPWSVRSQQVVDQEQGIEGVQAEADTLHRVIPGGALLRSAVLPGWGQFYTRHPLKGVLIMGVEAALIGYAVSADTKVKDFAAAGVSSDELDLWRNKRRKSILWAVGVWLYSMADAYVDAHLYDFDSNEPHFDIEPVPPPAGYGSIGIWVGIKIPIRNR